MRILIVSSYFPPQNAIASLRPYSWAKWWSNLGHDVTVITTIKNNIDYNKKLKDICSFELIEIGIPFFTRIKNIESNNIHNNYYYKNVFLINLKKLYMYISEKYGINIIRYPDYRELWIYNIKKYLKQNNRTWDVVVTTAGPYCVHRIGLFLKKRKRVRKWIVDWRDLFIKNHVYKGFSLFRPYEYFIDKLFNSYSDLVTTVSEPLADEIACNAKTSVKVIYNGYEPDDYIHIKENPRKNNNIYTILYTGSIYKGFRDPEPLFKAISNLKKEGFFYDKKIIIQFAGPNCNVKDIADKYDITEYYEYLGFLPREIALQLQYDADVLLFLEHEGKAKGILTGKLFEYLYIAREIWAVGITENTAAGEIIKKTNTGYSFGTDVEKIKNHIRNIFIKKCNNKEINKEIIKMFERKIQAEKFLEYI